MTGVLVVCTWILLLVASLGGGVEVAAAMVAVCAGVAVRRGHRSLVLVAICAGASMMLIAPLLHRYGSTTLIAAGPLVVTREGLVAGILYGTRLAAAILAVEVIARVPIADLITSAARIAPSSAMTGALAVRLGPLLRHDVNTIVEELSLRGADVRARQPLAARLRACTAVLTAFVTGMFERAFLLADTLHVRGYGAGRTAPERTAPLDAGARRGLPAARLALVLAAAAAALVAADATMLAPDAVAVAAAPLVIGACVAAMLACRLAGARGTVEAEQTAPRTASPLPTALPGAAVSVAGLSVARAGRPILAGLAMEVPASTWACVVGPSGSGKSTLLGVLAGSVPTGSVDAVSGRVCVGAPYRPDGVGVVFQDPEQHTVMPTVAEEIAMPLRWCPDRGKPIQHEVGAALSALGIGHLATARTADLSGGELQLVQLAAAIAGSPRLLLLDEPFSQLDAVQAQQVATELRRLACDAGTTVIHIEHDPQLITQVADRVLMLDGGRICDEIDLSRVAPGDRLALVGRALHVEPPPQPPARPVRAPRLVARCVAQAARIGTLRTDDLRLAAGEAAVIVAPTGAGKTTILRALAGLTGQREIVLDGHRPPPHGTSPWLAYVAQHAGPSLSGTSVMGVVTGTARRLGIEARIAEAAIEAAGLDALADAHPMDLSVGQRQRLAIVAGTLVPAPVWILDEPSRGLDPVGRAWLTWHIRCHLAAGGVAVIATHDVELARALDPDPYTVDAHGWMRRSSQVTVPRRAREEQR